MSLASGTNTFVIKRRVCPPRSCRADLAGAVSQTRRSPSGLIYTRHHPPHPVILPGNAGVTWLVVVTES